MISRVSSSAADDVVANSGGFVPFSRALQYAAIKFSMLRSISVPSVFSVVKKIRRIENFGGKRSKQCLTVFV
jgi:hypothetical protein